MNYIIILILTILILILIILYIGLKIKIKYQISDYNINLKIQAKLFKIPIYKTTIPKKHPKKDKTEDKENEEKNNQKFKKLIPLLKKSKNEIITIIKIFKNSTQILKFKNYIKIGLDDYVKTVEIIGYIRIINTLLNISDKNTLIAEADFKNENINIDGELKFKINLLNFIIKTSTNKQTRKFIKKAIGVYIK